MNAMLCFALLAVQSNGGSSQFNLGGSANMEIGPSIVEQKENAGGQKTDVDLLAAKILTGSLLLALSVVMFCGAIRIGQDEAASELWEYQEFSHWGTPPTEQVKKVILRRNLVYAFLIVFLLVPSAYAFVAFVLWGIWQILGLFLRLLY